MQRVFGVPCSISKQWIGLDAVYPQIVRWKRKPIWLPPAKSKMFKVPPRLRLPEEESVEILRLYNNYRTYRKSIRQYLVELARINQIEFDEESVRKVEEEDFHYCSKVNDEWNEKIARIREQRLEKLYAERKEGILKTIERKQLEHQRVMQEIEEKVERTKEEAKTFITRENIDEAIEKALLSVVNYNAAIDSEGRYIQNRQQDKQQAASQV